MGAWGIKALECDEGLDVLDILKNEYVPEHPVMDLGEMIELMKEEVMLGSDFSQIDFLFDNTAMALAELYFQWKDNGKLDYDHEEAIWDKVTGFTASKEALAFLLRQLTDIKNEVPDEDGIREIVDLWKNEDSGEIAPAWLEHLNQLIDRLDSEQEARHIPYTPQNVEEFFAQIEQWNDEDEYTRCIQALNAIPEDWRNYRTAYAMARALENYAVLGDHHEEPPYYKAEKALLRAIELLELVREEGQDKAQWNMRMA